MTADERDAYVADIVTVAIRTDAVVFQTEDSTGAVQYALFPTRRVPLEYAVQRRPPVRRKRKRSA